MYCEITIHLRIEIDFHFVKENILSGDTTAQYVNSNDYQAS